MVQRPYSPFANARPLGPFVYPDFLYDGTYDVDVVSDGDDNVYRVNGEAQKELTLNRGSIYKFNVDATGHPFFINNGLRGGEFDSKYSEGVSVDNPYKGRDYAVEKGNLFFKVPEDAPFRLHYVCGIHEYMGASINVED
jgi:hypothetical protein